MKKLFRGFVLLLAGLLTVSMLIGCGSDDLLTDEPVPVNFYSATPPGGDIAANGTITITFDNAPTDVTVSAGTVTVAGRTATITGPFTPGSLPLTIRWADGTQVLHYIVTAPCCSPPAITGGTVKDGDIDVDPGLINSDGKIEIEFSEEVTGKIALYTEGGIEGGDDVGWIGKVAGTKGTLELIKGRELINETVYVIVGRISDTEGNQTDIKITFVTRGKA